MEEIWKTPLPELIDFCQVSNLGRVKYLALIYTDSNARQYFKKEKIASLRTDAKIYPQVSFKNQKYTVHRLVATAFIPNPEDKPFVNHINGMKADNRVENLEWCTNGENMKHAYRIGLIFAPCDKVSKLTREQVAIIRERAFIKSKENRTVNLAKEFGVTRETIASIKHRRSWKDM